MASYMKGAELLAKHLGMLSETINAKVDTTIDDRRKAEEPTENREARLSAKTGV